MKKIITFLLLFFTAITILLVTLNKNNDKEDNKIVVAEVTHSVFYTPWYAAIEKNYFKNAGLDIEVILTPGADKVATSVISGDANIGFSGPEATIYVYNNSRQKLLTFASLTKRDGQFIVGDRKYKDRFKMEALIGKTILAGRSAGMPLMMFEYALKESGISKEELTINKSVEFSGLTGAYIAGEGDFVNLFEPNASKLEKEKYGCVLASLGNITGVVPYTTFYADEVFYAFGWRPGEEEIAGNHRYSGDYDITVSGSGTQVFFLGFGVEGSTTDTDSPEGFSQIWLYGWLEVAVDGTELSVVNSAIGLNGQSMTVGLIPEPTTTMLLLLGLASLALRRRLTPSAPIV